MVSGVDLPIAKGHDNQLTKIFFFEFEFKKVALSRGIQKFTNINT